MAHPSIAIPSTTECAYIKGSHSLWQSNENWREVSMPFVTRTPELTLQNGTGYTCASKVAQTHV